jgi:hypothetical protein
MPIHRFVRVLVILLFAVPAAAQTPATDTTTKQATAIRVANDSITLDGRLVETTWETAPAVTDLVQKEPIEGAEPSERTEVRFLYDDNALYIGAHMYKNPGSSIQAVMARRDRVEQSEHILIALDTFLDRRTAYVFGVTAQGVRVDRYHARDDETVFDETYDMVWQAKTTVDAGGWTAEMWIPFSQLRFDRKTNLVWGLNIHRYTPSLDEDDYWAPVPRTVRAWSSRFGNLVGISGLPSSRPVEVSPYVASSSTVNGNRDPRNPFDNGLNLKGRVGADLKAGLGPNLTLDAAINPDFGQVEADGAEVNLTGQETFFSEKRPFFLEGASLMNLSPNTNLFYSRRIGARPVAPAPGDFSAYPAATTILGAAKLTGRLASGTSIGAMGAVTDAEDARTFSLSTSTRSRTLVAPRTVYGVGRVQQEFGKSQSTVSGIATIVQRSMNADEPIAQLLPRSALSLGGDAVVRFKDGEYEWQSLEVFTLVQGEPAAVARAQRNSAHYSQRPDRTYHLYDPTRTSWPGWWTINQFARTGGRHWIWTLTNEIQSPDLEHNDLGRLTSADGIQANADVRWRETVPGRYLRSYWIGGRQNNEWTFGRERTTKSAAAYASATFKNFWTSSATYTQSFDRFDIRLARGGPTMAVPPSKQLNLSLKNRASSPRAWSIDLTRSVNDDGGFNNKASGSLTLQMGPRWQLAVTPTLQRQVDTQQYITALTGGGPETFGGRYVFATIDRHTYSMQFRTGFTLKPDVNLDVYAEPFAASGRYWDVGELVAPRTRLRRVYGTDGTTASRQPDGSLVVQDGLDTFRLPNTDFNVHSFRSNVVLRWEYRPGSMLFLVWQQDRRLSEPLATSIDFSDPFRSLTIPGTNAFIVKMSYWLPI